MYYFLTERTAHSIKPGRQLGFFAPQDAREAVTMTKIQSRIPTVNISWTFDALALMFKLLAFYCFVEMSADIP